MRIEYWQNKGRGGNNYEKGSDHRPVLGAVGIILAMIPPKTRLWKCCARFMHT